MNSLKQQTRHLYRLCFDDDEAFADAYFNYLYTTRRNVTLTRHGEVVSAMQIVPVAIHLSNRTTEGAPAGYISGACTHPAYRGKGLMRTLLERALQKRYKAGDLFATLIPAHEGLFGYYALSGFTPCFDYAIETIKTAPAAGPVNRPILPQPIRELPRWGYEPWVTSPESLTCILLETPEYSFFAQYIQARRNYHGYHYYFGNYEKLAEKDMELYGGETWITKTPENRLTGHAICYPRNHQLFVPSVTADTPEIRDYLIQCMATHYRLPEINIITEPAKERNTFHLGMARLVNASKGLSRYAEEHPDLQAKFRLVDPLIPENNATYALPGTGRFSQSQESAPTVSVEQLTQALLGYHPEQLPEPLQHFPAGLPYMHLMLN